MIQNLENIDESENLTPEILVCADFGGMGTKALTIDRVHKTPVFIYMGAEVAIDVSGDAIKRIDADNFGVNSSPETRAWCAVGSSKNKSYAAVGALAEKRFGVFTSTKIPKHELAFFKVLALFWVVKEKFNLPSRFQVSLSFLLPPGEFDNRFKLEEMLREFSKEFDSPSGLLSVDIKEFDCKPEGAGILLYLKSVKSSLLTNKSLSLVMIGYRNASLMIFNDNTVTKKISSELGMNYMMEKVSGYSSSDTPLSFMVQMIVEAGDDINPQPLSKLLKTTLLGFKEDELKRWQDTINRSRTEYLDSLFYWLRENVPKNNDYILFCGGTAHYLKSFLNNFAQEQNWEIINDDFIKFPVKIDPMKLGQRLNDLYGIYCVIYTKWKKK